MGLGVGGQASVGISPICLMGKTTTIRECPPSGNAGQKDIIEPSIDALSEFKVVTNGYSAEYGRSSSGVISAAIKSGTNDFHGEGYEFFRNAALDAENLFTQPGASKPQFGRNQFGGAIGGPVIRNKTFFFGDFEIGLIRESSTSTSTLPTASEHNGQFSTPIYDPTTGAAFPLVNGFYTIPAGRLDPIAQKILRVAPPAADVRKNKTISCMPVRKTLMRTAGIFRVDQILTDKQKSVFSV